MPLIRFRNYKEFQPDEFTFENPKFNSTLESIFEKVKKEFDFQMDVILQKLVICGKGNQFATNLDVTGENQFATLIIQLPSFSTGNNLTIRHDNETKTIEFDRKESSCEILYSAFYSNCDYKMTPLESGYRLVLVYNLTSNDSAEHLKRLQESTSMKQDIATTLSEVKDFRKLPGAPQKSFSFLSTFRK